MHSIDLPQVDCRRPPPRDVPNTTMTIFRKSQEGGVREGGVTQICRKLRAKFAQNCRYFVLYIRGRVREIVANCENQFRTILCKYPFSNAPFSEFRAELKVTHLRWRSPICENLRFPAKIWGFLRNLLQFPGEGVRKSAVFCEICVLGFLCHLRSVPQERALLWIAEFLSSSRHSSILGCPGCCNVKTCRVLSRCFQGIFKVFSGYFQGVVRVFSRCFQGVFRELFGCFQGGFSAFSGSCLGVSKVFSGYFQGVFRVFSGSCQCILHFQRVFRVFSWCFQGVFPHALSGYALWTLPNFLRERGCCQFFGSLQEHSNSALFECLCREPNNPQHPRSRKKFGRVQRAYPERASLEKCRWEIFKRQERGLTFFKPFFVWSDSFFRGQVRSAEVPPEQRTPPYYTTRS